MEAATMQGPAGGANEATMSFLLGLRARGINNVDILRALEKVPRERFVPHRYIDLALRNVALPIGCGQTMPEPLLVARMIEALDPAPGHRVLEIGTGSGYATAVLAQIVHEVVSFERFHSLASEAAARLQHLGITNAKIVRGDGLALQDVGLFDRILVHAELDPLPQAIVAMLAADGAIVHARQAVAGRARLVRLAHGASGFQETSFGACRLGPLIPGLSLAL
ncbi:MAG TPA: rRNA adenine N-6-methyltransferase family protein [Beijerinckiaceae bacterium]|jgi:protein-L-isoaspartate(D-aspartate) O-methyltransferase|nr:rRNA adenine N-6-methyltransferase family protein [Beijerinckiaceae bacterium]